MKRLLSVVLILLILIASVAFSANATTIEQELATQMFDYFDGEHADLSYYPDDVPPVIIGDYVETEDAVIFVAYAIWRGVDTMPLVEVYDDCCVYAGGYTYPSHTAMFVRKDGVIYTLREAWDNGVICDLTPAIGFSTYTRVYPLGDADLDFKLSILDATQIQLKKAQLFPSGKLWLFEVSDFDTDGNISVMDATAIQRKLAQID